MRLIFSPRAKADLDDVWDYTTTRWSLDQAERYLRRIQRATLTIAEAPKPGRSCDEIRPGYFKRTVGSHVIFYRLRADAVDIVRILHVRMDFDRHL